MADPPFSPALGSHALTLEERDGPGFRFYAKNLHLGAKQGIGHCARTWPARSHGGAPATAGAMRSPPPWGVGARQHPYLNMATRPIFLHKGARGIAYL